MKIYWGTLLKKHTPDKDKFPFGIWFFDGKQGSGKTLSCVFLALDFKKKYEDLHLISNVEIKEFEDAEYFETPTQLVQILNANSNHKHTLVIIDEALSYFAENGGIDPALMSEITQNRKQRRLMFIATQKFKRVNNRLRDFSMRTIKCRSFFSIQYNVIRDDEELVFDKQSMDFVGHRIGSFLFKRNNELYSKYDTFAKTKIDTTKRTDTLLTARAPAPSYTAPEALPDNKEKKGMLWLK